MTLAAGTRIGAYEVRAAVGAGGMGEVYRARDLTLDRDVALKVLPDEFAADSERLERFTREAKALAALNHASIAHIYGFDETAIGPRLARVLVMEFVDGEDLSARIDRGPIPLAEALPIARQIAEALEAAHEQGIVHRDLKPANVKVTDSGIVKVLDFGLAKAFDAPGAPVADAANSPTLTGRATQLGVILGTAAYMAPEQAKGRPVDKRADYWAFGVVLYEMLTGRRAFEGGDVTEVLASVIKDTPSLDALPSGTPASVRRLLRRCLAKDRRERIADASTIRLEIDEALSGESVASIVPPAAARTRVGPAMIAGAIGLAVLVGLAAWTLKPAPSAAAPAVTRFTVALPGNLTWSRTGRHVVAIAPDGARIAYIAGQQLFTRPLDQLEATALANVRDPNELFFSPDGKWVGTYFGGKLQKIALSGGAPVPLCVAAAPYGVSWDRDGMVFAQDDGIFRVSENGGTPELIARRAGTERLSSPQMLPGGRSILMTKGNGSNASWDDAEIIVEELDTHERTVVIRGGSDARYVSTGHLVYARAGDVLAVPFALDTRRVGGTPVSLLSGVAMATGNVTGGVQAALSDTGTMVYVAGVFSVDQQLVWEDRQGREEMLATESAVNYPRVSPDGTRIAFNATAGGNVDIFIRERMRDARTRLTFEAAPDVAPVWTPDGRRIVYASSRNGAQNLYWQPADGTGTAERLTTSPKPQFPYAITPDGGTLLYIENDPKTLYDIYTVSLTGDRKPRPVLVTPADERRPALSPDGRWMAYQSDESTGAFEVFVRPFPNVDGGRWQVSTGGGSSPLWGDGGREVLYRQDQVIRRVPVTTTPTFAPGTSTVLLQVPSLIGDDQGVNYTYWPGGQRFLMRRPAPGANGVFEYRVVLNWFEELKARAR